MAFRRRDRYDLSHRNAAPWLFGIATNMISRHRQAEVRLYRALARVGVDPAVESPGLPRPASGAPSRPPWPG